MAQGPDRSQKTEKPTPKRRREARERGQIARSQDLAVWSSMLASTLLLRFTASRAGETMRQVFFDMAHAISSPDARGASRFFVDALLESAVVVAPLLVGLLLLTVAVQLAQVGLKPSLKRLKPDFGRLNAFKGLRRMVGASSLWEVAKAVAKTAVLFAVAWPAITHAADRLTAGGGSVDGLAAETAGSALAIIRNVAVVGLGIAAIDYVVQRRRITRELSMTRQELREELKQHEGNPQMRQAIRSRQAAIGRNQMIRMVSAADVVVVNPTHYAVALRYETLRGAPEVVAKGAGVMAARIRAEAEANDVPVVHEPVLTRALYRACEVGRLIPLELYEAVAHLLAFVFSLRARGRATGYHELPEPLLTA